MEELERKNPNKRKTQVFIKTMNRGRIVSNEKRTLGSGSDADGLRHNAYNYLQHSFPEENYLSEFPLHHYRFPTEGPSNAIAFFFHDQSRYCGKYAHVAEKLAARGIEVVGFDLPGHGKNKDSPRGYFGTYEKVHQHAREFIKATIDKLDYGTKPKFSIGISTGALTALNMAHENQKMFNGVNVI